MSVRHDWYQSETKVVVTVMLKNAVEKNYNVVIERDNILMTAENYELKLELCHPIVPEKSSHKATPSKVEISLAKETGERWSSLEKKSAEAAAAPNTQKNKQNWDKFVNEFVAKDQQEAVSDEALNSLFQKIYADGNPEVRRAMDKSFMESGGTVLSTNWKEVGQKKVEVKPPDGCEYKKWD
ncbi:protein SGT1 homolog [Condylostylus longicornis]|uniref:protein SGT1 homolog n=1 Tax=Condylostylus longicornis TaxID=2530218 RepID=UPI00244E4A3B|nr:protein SGT1 homolog [Condylostylus longicornis]